MLLCNSVLEPVEQENRSDCQSENELQLEDTRYTYSLAATKRHEFPLTETSTSRETHVSTCKTMEDDTVSHQREIPVNGRRELEKPLPEPDRSTSAIWRAPRKSRSKLNLCTRLSLEDVRPKLRSRAP